MESRIARLGLTLGDPSGIGPEVIAKILAKGDRYPNTQLVVVGDQRLLKMGFEIAGESPVEIPVVSELTDEIDDEAPFVMLEFPTCGPGDFAIGEVGKVAGKASFETLVYTLGLTRAGQLDGFVFGPLNKEAMHLGGNPHKSELEFFQKEFQQEDVENELNYLEGLWTTRVTSHVGLSEVCPLITKANVLKTLRFMDSVLRDYGHEQASIAVAALNPHAGEHGLFGREEMDEIEPAVLAAQAEGINARGPFPADTVFLRVRRERYHGLVSMYHDQGQIAMKLMGFERGVTVAGGLPVPISTPAHGTAHDIAGKGIADPSATHEAIQVASTMVKNRKGAAETRTTNAK